MFRVLLFRTLSCRRRLLPTHCGRQLSASCQASNGQVTSTVFEGTSNDRELFEKLVTACIATKRRHNQVVRFQLFTEYPFETAGLYLSNQVQASPFPFSWSLINTVYQPRDDAELKGRLRYMISRFTLSGNSSTCPRWP